MARSATRSALTDACSRFLLRCQIVGRPDAADTREIWNAASTWRVAYGDLFDSAFVFAEDAFGFPWCIEDGAVTARDAETGLRTEFAATIEEWAAKILLDWRLLTAQPLAHDWQMRFGPLPPERRLAPKVPFVLGGEFEVDNLYAADPVELMRFRGSIATQIRDVPDGTRVRLKTLV